jgi:uncharacterized protein YjdB
MFKIYAKLIVQKVSSIGLAIKSNQAKARLKISLSILALSMFLSLGSSSLFAQTGGALNFNGSNNKVTTTNTGNVFDFTTGTVEAWVKPSASSNNCSILSMRTAGNVRWSMHLKQSAGTMGIYNGSNGAMNSVGTVTANTWYHVAIVFNSTNILIYWNGNLVMTHNYTMNASKTGLPFSIGNNDTNYLQENFLGEMDEVRVWNTVRTQSDIQKNMFAEIATSATGLLANYHFDQGTAAGSNSGATTLTDASGNNYNGTLSGFALTGATSNWIARAALVCPTTSLSPITGLSAVCASQTITLQNNTLNTTSQAMMIGYSLRKLLGSYSGNAVRVRRSSDNSETNIGFTATGDFDEAALKTFAGSGNAFVTIWYDQSGSAKNMVQTSTGQQPQILFSGSLKYINSRPTLDFKDNKGLKYSVATKMASASVVIKSESTVWPNYHAILDGGGRIGGLLENNNTVFYSIQYGTALWKNGTSIATNSSLAPTNVPMVVSFTSQLAAGNGNASGLCIGNYDLGGGGGSILQTEAIAFATTASSADRQTVEVNQGSYYGITSVVGTGSAGNGVWSSDDISIAEINSTTGVVTGKSQGTVNVNYSFTNSYGCTSTVTKNITVNIGPVIATTTGLTIVCAKSTITLANATAGGVWSSGDTQKATVDSSTGVVTGLSAGDVIITYTVTSSAGCPSLANHTISVKATAPITSDVPVVTDMQILLVAGGGGGGMDMGGGGGGGGVIYKTLAFDPSAIPYTITIGAGGTGAPAAGTNGQPGGHQFTIPAKDGGNTTLAGLTAIGGGYGGSSVWSYTPGGPGSNGGSGGGASGYNSTNGAGAGSGTSGQGFSGGNAGGNNQSGGGGGAGGAGISGPSLPNGGTGIQYSAISPFYWGGGGGGSGYTINGGNGGIGGGGGGAVGVTTGGLGLNNGLPGGGGNINSYTNRPGGNAGANTGGGGGGGSHFNSNNKGGDGGSGVVIIKYAGTPRATGGIITQVDGFTTHTFSTVGTSSFTVSGGATTGVCIGNSKNLANATTGGVWSSSNSSIASIDASTGVVTGNQLGSCIIIYTVTEPTTGCAYSSDINFIVANPPTITAVSSSVTCAGAPAIITATPSVSGGSIIRWYDAPTGGNLLYTGATFTTPVFTANVSYYVEVNNYGCSSVRTEVPVTTVLPTTGIQTLCVKSTVNLSNPTSGNNGVWTTSNSDIATVDATTGVVSGMSGGNVVISYTVPTGTNCPATYNLTVTAVAPTMGNGVSNPFQVLVVAGGGGGGSEMGGGGGGGGVIYSSNVTIASTSTPFNVVVGAGGAGTPAGAGKPRGSNGVNSSFNGLIAIGGGGGASGHNFNTSPASVGGSGGGASGAGGVGNINNGGKAAAGTLGQGFEGGNGSGDWYPGGGGGAGGAGATEPAHGGIGIKYADISTYFWGGGGGGSGHSAAGGNGGIGGGGGGARTITSGGAGINNGSGGTKDGESTPGGNAGANTGGGGGGGSHYNTNNNGGDGGSGIVIIKYLGTPKAVGGTITQSGGYTTHTFTTVGTNTFTLTDGGTGGVCLGNTTQLTNATAGGTWSSSDPTIASVDASGLVTGNQLGTCTIKYSVTEPTTGCVNTWDLSFIVASPPTKPDITSTVVCVNSSAVITASSSSIGQSFRWYDAPTGGNLLYTGESYTTPVFTSNVSYYVEVNSYGCSSPRTEVPLTTVLSTTGPTIVCVNSTITLANATTGGVGTWSSSENSIATVNPNTGVVTGVGAGGDVVISYTFPTAVNCPATYNVSVKAVLPITGVGATAKMEILMVAGGGGGGADMGGGGGGGGVIYNSEVYIADSNTPFSIVIGDGGVGTPAGTTLRGTNGSNTTFYGLTAIGGGGGATGYNFNTSPAGNGGSGGGASGGGTPANGNGGAPGNGTAGQGFNGADGKNTWYPGGGGGAGGVGVSSPATGGPGIQYAISPYFWGGGGGGSGYSLDGGDGGIGGGGGGAVGVTTGGLGINNGLAGGGGSRNSQTNKPGGNAGANTGGGGGGGSHFNSNNKGGNGGSGIVIIKYLGVPIASGGVITLDAGYTTHTFANVGANTFTLTGGTKAGVCLGGTTLLTNATAGGVWSSSDATIASIDASGLVTGNKLGTCTITYSVTEPTTNCVYSSSILFLVASPPSISSVTGSVTCVGSSAVITANTTSEAPSFRWYDAATGGNLLYTGQTYTTPIFTSNVSYFVEIDSYGCTSTSRIEVPVTAINVVITPDVANYNSPGICLGGSVTFTASGATSYSWGSKAAPLDDVASTYKLAVSLRKLRSAYAGSAIRLRRSSDNIEADFGFIGNDLNTAAISTWLGSANGFCVKLYDQSGNNNDMVPLSVGAQPLYVASGSSMNNKPILRFTTSQNLKSTFSFTTPYTATIAARYSGSSRGRVLNASNNWLLGWYSGNRGSAHLDGWVSNGVGGAAGTTPYVYTATGTGSASTIYENSVDITQNPTGGRTAPQGLVINGGENSDCEIGEIIGFSSVLSTEDREWVEKSSGGYFGIYGTGNSYSTAAITVSPIETTTYVLKATSSTGCVVSKEVTITVNQVPTPTVLAIGGGPYLGINKTSTLTNAVSGGKWYSSNTGVATIDLNSGLVSGSSIGSTTISYILTNSTGCTATATLTLKVVKSVLNRNGKLAVSNIVSRNGVIGGSGMTPNGERIYLDPDGLSAGSAGVSAKAIKAAYPAATDGVYWITVPGVGAVQTYCLMDSKYDGGGWMMALKATRGTTFKYDADYWTTANTLNPTQVNRNDGDAKYDVMNAYLAKDMMALFPDIPNSGTESGSIDNLTNWSWLQNDFHNSGAKTALIDKFSGAQTTYFTSNSGAMPFDGYGTSAFSKQGGFTWYGINYTGQTSARMRWGFAWNNEGGEGSNDVSSGIGMANEYGAYSAGDRIGCCQNANGINRSARVEIYVR